jgi:hypothetical protein
MKIKLKLPQDERPTLFLALADIVEEYQAGLPIVAARRGRLALRDPYLFKRLRRLRDEIDALLADAGGREAA